MVGLTCTLNKQDCAKENEEPEPGNVGAGEEADGWQGSVGGAAPDGDTEEDRGDGDE